MPPPDRVLTNGRPKLMASVRTIGIPSARAGDATTRARRNISFISMGSTGARAPRRSASGGSAHPQNERRASFRAASPRGQQSGLEELVAALLEQAR
jgi:hypothetical protein